LAWRDRVCRGDCVVVRVDAEAIRSSAVSSTDPLFLEQLAAISLG
jgi:hypothetical protein